jgi:hypothetical protein
MAGFIAVGEQVGLAGEGCRRIGTNGGRDAYATHAMACGGSTGDILCETARGTRRVHARRDRSEPTRGPRNQRRRSPVLPLTLTRLEFLADTRELIFHRSRDTIVLRRWQYFGVAADRVDQGDGHQAEH